MARAWIWGLVLAVVPFAQARSAPPARWQALADCAAAYRANAQIKDPDRAASMTAQISETAGDYAKAALKAYPKSARRAADMAVQSRIVRQTAKFARQPRTQVEHVIDACPQLEE